MLQDISPFDVLFITKKSKVQLQLKLKLKEVGLSHGIQSDVKE